MLKKRNVNEMNNSGNILGLLKKRNVKGTELHEISWLIYGEIWQKVTAFNSSDLCFSEIKKKKQQEITGK